MAVMPVEVMLTDADTEALQSWIRRIGLGSTVSDVTPLTGGSQNIVVQLSVDGRPMVLRRPPEHPRPTSDNTMRREIAVLTTLAGSPVPHPELIAGCDDLDVLGVVFYLMEAIDGFNPGTDVDDAYVRDPRMRHDVGISYAASLAALSAVPWQGSALAQLKRPGSFLARQVPQFMRLLESYRHDRYAPESFPSVAGLAEWLEAHRPPDADPAIMHGDCHLNNVLLRRDVAEVAAFIDWEMCTIGDPLLDLGWMLVCWPDGPNPIDAGAALASLGGLPTRTELLAAYRDAGGRPTERLDWYVAMACFKLGIVIEGTWSRYLAGQASAEAGERLHASAENLIELGTRVAHGDNVFL
jgi:aminoglycoside phosphotransferase (APT) family kinase protein